MSHLSSLLLLPALLVPGSPSPERQVGGDEALDPALAAERSIAALVKDERAAAQVRALVALGPRMGGTASGLAAVEHLEKAFRGMGLGTLRHEARKTWCHQETAWSVKVTPEGQEPFTLERVWPRGFSPASRGRARLGLELDPGGVLLASRYRPRRKEARPLAVLDDGLTTLDGAWPVCASHPRGRRAEVPIFGLAKPDGERLRAALDDGRTLDVEWSLETTIQEASPLSVVAILPPAEGASEGHLLICAHGDSDSGGPGANDNASGVAIVLEMARAWTGAIEAGLAERPPVEVRFVIWGKEIHSTSDYARGDIGKGLLGVLNFDQAGFGSTGDRIHVEPDDLEANVAFVQTALGVLGDHAGAIGFPERWATNKSLGGTDSYVFSGSKRFRTEKLPSVTMFTSAWGKPDEQPRTEGMPGESWTDDDQVTMDYDVHYHSAGDTPANTTDREPHNMGWCARVGLLTVMRYLGGLETNVPPEVK